MSAIAYIALYCDVLEMIPLRSKVSRLPAAGDSISASDS